MIKDMLPIPAAEPSKEELVRQQKMFLAGAGNISRHGVSPQLCDTALFLLSNLPAAREAVLEWYSLVLDGVLERFNVETGSSYEEEEILSGMSRTLIRLMSTSPSPWAPIISSWSLECLGKLSSKWSSKVCGKSSSLHEKLSSWLRCHVARVLLDLSADCLSRLMDSKVETKEVVGSEMSDTESCIAALLETSVKHTPHFDWVIAHVGSCFPHTVTERVLSVGLKDFLTASKEAGPTVTGQQVLVRSARLSSVVNILSHLTLSHLSDVQRAIESLVASAQSNPPTIPFLLALAVHSPGVRRALTTDLATLIPSLLPSLPDLYHRWENVFYNKTNNTLLAEATQLLLATDRGGPNLLLLLLKLGSDSESIAARTLLNCCLSELSSQVGSRSRLEDVPLLTGMSAVLPSLMKLMLSSSKFQVSSSSVLVYLYCQQKGRSVSASVLKFLLSNGQTESHLETASQLVVMLEQFHFDIVKDAVSAGLRDNSHEKMITLMRNLISLSSEERWARAVSSCQSQLIELLASPHLTGDVLQLLRLVPSHSLRVKDVYKLSQAVVGVVLDTVASDVSQKDKMLRVSSCEEILRVVCGQKCGLQITLRFLLDSCLNTSFSLYLGGRLSPEETVSPRQQQAISLLESNYKSGTKPVQPLGSSTTFHAGVIGAGAKTPAGQALVSSEVAEVNRRLVVGVISRLAEASYPGQEEGEGNKQLALMLVEIISPDIMYNGLPWPEEEFMKVTIERDLSISRFLARHPLVWSLLSGLAAARPSLCFCSVIVRAVMAVLISHWSSHVTSSLTGHPAQLQLTVRLLELMAVGQFIPPQLAITPQIIHILDPFQLHCVLVDIWHFMTRHVPGPSLYVTDERTGQTVRNFGPYKNYHGFCERLRVVLVKNIDTVAVIFKKHFVDALKENGEKNHSS